MTFLSSYLQIDQTLFSILALLLSFGGVCIWWFFFSHFSSSLTTPQRALQLSFISGIIAMVSSFFVEQLVFNLVNVNSIFYAFAATALVEESIKFFILKKQLETHNVDQVIDGMKLGLWLGFGFAFAENFSYFFNFFSAEYSLPLLALTIFIRGILATLAHGLYGVVMGYYMSLARFHFLYRPRFLKISLAASVLIHGFFNLFLIVSMGAWSVLIIVISLGIVLMWYNDRRSIEINIDTAFATEKAHHFWPSNMSLKQFFQKTMPLYEFFPVCCNGFPTRKTKISW